MQHLAAVRELRDRDVPGEPQTDTHHFSKAKVSSNLKAFNVVLQHEGPVQRQMSACSGQRSFTAAAPAFEPAERQGHGGVTGTFGAEPG